MIEAELTQDTQFLKAPFPYFGGKSRVADEVWARFGDVPNYVEPFFGSGAVLLGRPHAARIETVNDKDGFVSNFWRAISADPEAVAHYADWPVNENDLHARHAWLVNQRSDLTSRLEGDPGYFDAQIAGWWCWGLCSWIGGGWCDGVGPWRVIEGRLVNRNQIPVDSPSSQEAEAHLGDAGTGVNRKLAHLGDAGKGVNRQLAHLGDAGKGVNRQLAHLGNAGTGIEKVRPSIGAQQGVHKKRVSLGSEGRGLGAREGLLEWFFVLGERLRSVRVCCGDWQRILGPSPTTKLGMTAVFLDPPYSAAAERHETIYAMEDLDVAHAVREWAIAHGEDSLLRIALCGYEEEHAMPSDWECLAWKAKGGYGNQGSTGGANSKRERIWFSPGCLRPSDDLLGWREGGGA